MRLILGRERIVDGTTAARQQFADLFELASGGTPVLVVSGDRQVLMIDRRAILELAERVEAAEETLTMLAAPELLEKLRKSEEDVRAARGVSPEEASRLLGIDE